MIGPRSARLVRCAARGGVGAADLAGAGERWRLAAFLLLGPRRGERTGIAHVVPGGLDPAVGALDVHKAELVAARRAPFPKAQDRWMPMYVIS
jgi:hypothetical protein